MRNNEHIKTRNFFLAETKLRKLSEKRRRIAIKLSSRKKSLEELEAMDSKTVYHKIDSILIPRDRYLVIKDEAETIETLSNQLKELDQKWDREMKAFKKLAANNKA
jgi:chaperonin cofactor prefoldin